MVASSFSLSLSLSLYEAQPDPITELFLSLKNLLSFFGEVFSSVRWLLPYFILAYIRSSRPTEQLTGREMKK
jgi:hypothetical protein